MTSQAGGKGVNISRAAVARRHPHRRRAARRRGRPVRRSSCCAAGIDCRPVPPAGDVRINITITEPDGTTTKLNSPAPTVDAAATSTRMAAGAARAAPAAPTGWCWPARCRRARPAGWYADLVAALRDAGARSRSTPPRRPLRGAGRRRSPRRRPDLIKPNGEELASLHRRRRRRARGRPGGGRRGGRATLVDRGVGAVLATLGGHGAVLVDRRGRLARHAPADRPSSAPSAPATPASSATSSATSAARAPAERLRLAVAYGSAAAGLPGTTIPNPVAGSARSWSSVRRPRPHRTESHDA